jgi:hypothetical protein
MSEVPIGLPVGLEMFWMLLLQAVAAFGSAQTAAFCTSWSLDMELKVLITSPPDREHLVAEIWADDCQLAEVSQEGNFQLLEVYPRPQGGAWRIAFDELLETMNQAKVRLAEVEGNEHS